jgi:D-alanyl-D-alanine carboxypeptidase (penicillin-binding protein 5/6)
VQRLHGCAALLVVALVASPAAWAAEDPFGSVAPAYLVEIDGLVVWQKNPAQRLPPASLTKLMTALLVDEQVDPEVVVPISAAAALATGSRLGLKMGEVYRAHDLLAAMLVTSANDACRALADHVGGDQRRFVRTMNQRAQSLGLRDTRFANACGHDAPGHFSSVQDLRLLAHALLQRPQLAALVAQPTLQIASVGGARRFSKANTNALLGRYPGAEGIKTGSTALAGHCLVALVRRGPHTVLLVLLKGRDRWWDAVDMLDIAIARANATP